MVDSWEERQRRIQADKDRENRESERQGRIAHDRLISNMIRTTKGPDFIPGILGRESTTSATYTPSYESSLPAERNKKREIVKSLLKEAQAKMSEQQAQTDNWQGSKNRLRKEKKKLQSLRLSVWHWENELEKLRD